MAVDMPQSRKRRRPPAKSSTRSRRGSGHPGRAHAHHHPSRLAAPDPDWPSDFEEISASIEQASRAELAGDAVEAFRLYCGFDRAADTPHGARLGMLAALGDDAPGWLISRWLTVQARRVSDDASRAALERVVDRLYCEHALPDGVSAGVFLATAYEHDWALRQLALYDEGGLAATLTQAEAGLTDRADHIEEWAHAPMGGWRLEASDPTGLTFTDLATDEEIVLLDLGLAEKYEPGQCLVGRIVPISESPGRMFEWMPLEIDEVTARQVATCASDDGEDWFDVLCRREREGILPSLWSRCEWRPSMLGDFEVEATLALLSDRMIELVRGEPEERMSRAGLAMLCCEDILRVVVMEPRVIEPIRWLLSVLVVEAMDSRGRGALAMPEFHDGWVALAEALPEPARSVCSQLAAASVSRRRPRTA